MRNNIEEQAADEEEIRREENWERFRGIFLLAGWGLGFWGWYGFAHEHLGSGAVAIVLSLIFLALRWNASKAVRMTTESFWLGIAAGGSLFILYFYTALPNFYWGQDPAFWLAVQAGAVIEPAWSPLSYLIGQTTCFLFPVHAFSILPQLSSLVTAVVIFFVSQELLSQFKSNHRLNLILVFVACVALGLTRPFWNAGTMALGLVSALGLLLFLLQRHLLQLGKDYAAVSYFLLGLLWSAHPLWGLMGTLAVLLDRNKNISLRQNWIPLGWGLSPYLWIVFRTGKNFPSWGGTNPFGETLKECLGLFGGHFLTDWSWQGAVRVWGWEVGFLLILSAVLGLVNWFKGVEVFKKGLSAADFWLWLLAGVGAFFFYSYHTDYLGVTSLWFVTAVVGFFIISFDRRAVGIGWGSKQNVGLLSIVGILLACGLSWLPGQGYFRDQYFFPQQHAFNLVRTLGPQTALVCDDPFEFNACLDVRWMEPSKESAFILNKKYLDQRWYVSEWIEHEPGFFFSTITGPTDLILKSVILNNRDTWQIQWSRAELPVEWHEPKADPAVLTQLFQSGLGAVDPAQLQYRYDLSMIPINRADLDPRASFYLSRYVIGFKRMGEELMSQKRYSEAIHAYDRAAKLDPLDQEALATLSNIYSQHNILEAAQLDYEAIVKSHPKQIDQVMKFLEAAQKQKNESKATDGLEQLVKLNNELADAQYQLSKIYNQQGRAEEAKALLEASVQVNPKQVEAQMTLGYSMQKAGDWAKAEEAFRSVIAVDPQNKEAQVELWKLLNKPKR
jgi:tetratricopeptide (TPR) repeat protein